MRYEYILKGLGCAHCASKMETEIKKIDGVKMASINFSSNVLRIQLSKPYTHTDIIVVIKDIVQKIEPHVTVSERNKEKKHSHDHDDSHENDLNKSTIVMLSLGTILFAISLIFNFNKYIELMLYISAYLILGGQILTLSFRNLFKGQLLDENFLMTIASLSAFFINEYPEAVAVMLFYRVGEIFEGIAINKSRKSIASLLDIRPDYANKKIDGEIIKLPPEKISVDDIIIVKPGEKIPLDGIVTEGSSTLDTSAITGESLPQNVSIGSNVFSGSINNSGLLTLKVTKDFHESTVSKILELVENASHKKAKTERFITKFARYYTPIVVSFAGILAIIPPLFIEGALFSDWIYRAAIFLVVSCPCALVLSVPLGYFGGIGAASNKGILIKGGNYLEALKNIDTIIFDKTGTLTKGSFEVSLIQSISSISNEEILKYAAYAESYSSHPIATSIFKAYGQTIDKESIKDYEEVSGHGVKVTIDDNQIYVGNEKLMDMMNIKYTSIDTSSTTIYVSINNELAGYILIEDKLKDDTIDGIEKIRSIGINNLVMLTGDNTAVAKKIGNKIGISNVYSELLPHEKVEKLEEIQNNKTGKGATIFVGDGINDAPVLSQADIGVSMGALGSDAAIESSDVILMTDEISKISTAIHIAKRTNVIVLQNIIFALAIKIIVLVLGASGMANMWIAVFADVGVAILAVLNSIRVMYGK